MTETTPKTIDVLEQIVDKTSMTHVLALLADICYTKAEHVAHNWQDEPLAKKWAAIGQKLDKTRNSIPSYL